MGETTKNNRTLLIVLIVAVIAVLCVLLYAFVIGPGLETKTTPEENEELAAEQNAELGIIPGMTDEEVQERLNQYMDKSKFNISINSVPYFPDGSSEGNLRLENVPNNHYAFTVEIVREDNGEQIYKSGLIDPGYYVETAKLDTDLPKGEYPCVATFTAYDPQTKKKMGTVGAQIVITVAA